MSPSDLASWLDPNQDSLDGLSTTLPLSMLALRASVRLLALPRSPTGILQDLLALLGIEEDSPEARTATAGFDNALADGMKHSIIFSD